MMKAQPINEINYLLLISTFWKKSSGFYLYKIQTRHMVVAILINIVSVKCAFTY